MKVIFKNLSSDLCGKVVFTSDEDFIEIPSLSQTEVEVQVNEITFSVVYNRDFSFGLKPEPKNSSKFSDKINNRLNDELFNSIGNAVVQIVNTYKISGLTDEAVIEINDRAHYFPVKGVYSFFKCWPALFYFGQAECKSGKIEVLSSVCTNRDGFIKFYRFMYGAVNMARIWNFIKYKVQVYRQKKISRTEFLTETFKSLYALPYDERDYQFKPIRVIADKVIENIKGKIPKKLYNKLEAGAKKKYAEWINTP